MIWLAIIIALIALVAAGVAIFFLVRCQSTSKKQNKRIAGLEAQLAFPHKMVEDVLLKVLTVERIAEIYHRQADDLAKQSAEISAKLTLTTNELESTKLRLADAHEQVEQLHLQLAKTLRAGLPG